MEVDLSKKTAVVIDCGIFVELAITLSKSFGKVYYFTPWNFGGFPDRMPELSGVGFDEITKIDYLFAKDDDETGYSFDDVDIFIFPELYFYDIEVHLREMGKKVWGSGEGQWLELDRYGAKGIMKDSNMPVNKTVLLKGTTKLRNYLKNHDNLFIKVSHWRGLVESFKHDTYEISDPMITNLENDLGPIKETTEFIVEEPIECIVEAGIDTYIIDGQIPDYVMSGIEIKDACYAGKLFTFSELPKLMKSTITNLDWYFKETNYRNFFSNEVRVGKDKIPYTIDFTCRGGAPPLALMLNIIENLAEIIWFGAQGILVDPKYTYEYGVILIGTSDFLRDNFMPVYFPDKIRENVKLRYGMKDKDTYYLIPQQTQSYEALDVVATGNSFEECFEKIKKYTEQIKGFGLTFNIGVLDKVQEEIEKSSKIGLKY